LTSSTIANAILWLTPEVANSDVIKKVEAPRILDRAAKQDGFFVVPVAAGGLDYKQSAQVIDPSFTLHDLEQWNMRKVSGDPIDEGEAAAIAKYVLHERLKTIHTSLPLQTPLQMLIHTGTPAPFTFGTALWLDWTHRFDSARCAKPGAWDNYLLPALMDVVETIQVCAPGRAVEATGQLSIPAAVALGCGFLEPRCLPIGWRPRQAPQQLWSISEQPESSGFQSNLMSYSTSADQLAVLVSVDNDVRPAFTSDRPHLPTFRAILEVTKQGTLPHRLATAGEAIDVASSIRAGIREAVNQFPELKGIHLFMAVPVGLAMMIGQLLNTLPPVQTYEFSRDGSGRNYHPAILMNPSW
jgi:hypothetical protein